MNLIYIMMMRSKRHKTRRRAAAGLRKKRTRKQRRRIKRRTGGNAFATGAYGCVFKPELQCDDNRARGTGVSKLMEAKYATKEIAEMDSIRKIIEDIPNNNNYFLIGNTYMCNPKTLSTDDLLNYDNTCADSLGHRGYTQATINNKLKDLRLINIPFGGLELDDYWRRILKERKSKSVGLRETLFINVHTKMLQLLRYAIVPMNQVGLNHNDLKGDNILVDDELNCRLIDWGLACTSTDTTKVPTEVTDYPLTFNRPFAHIFLRTGEPMVIPQTASSDKTTTYKENLREFAKTYLQKDVAANEGHYSAIIKSNIPSIDPALKGNDIIVDHLVAVLEAFVDKTTNKFDMVKYYHEVYQKNSDVWGFIMCYHDLTLKVSLSENPQAYIKKLKEIFKTYCYSPTYAAKTIPMDKLVKDLLQLKEK